MQSSTPPQSPNPMNALKTRSMGMKFLIVCCLALFMSIPGFFVDSLVDERTGRAAEVASEISNAVGGPQTLLGPTLAIPYTISATGPTDIPHTGTYFVSPSTANATLNTTTEERRRSLFRVPVFKAGVHLEAAFDLTGIPTNAPAGAQLDWSRAEFIVGLSDARGALSDATLIAGGKLSTLLPARTAPTLSLSPDGPGHLQLTLLGGSAAPLAAPDAKFSVTTNLSISGARHLAVLAYGKSTQVAMQGDWRSPGFDGGFLPVQRDLSPTGFTANWNVPFIARGVRGEGRLDDITPLHDTALGVTFVESADTYQSVTRSLKFILLFLGLVFLTYFVFEITAAKRIHPAQYVLVGVAQTIFYLLLLSLAERIGFDLGFLIAGSATVLLLSANAKWVFASNRQGARAFVVFTLLYGMTYMLLRLEDNALLVGAIASFLVVTAVMYATRNLNWYSSTANDDPGPVTMFPVQPRA